MRDELDSLIDEGLAAYGNIEPLAGLEERVLGRARSQRRARRWWWLAVPAAAAAGLSLWMAPPAAPPPPVVALAKPPAPIVVAPTPAPKRVVVRRAAKRTELPKRAVFPTVARLTPEERLLVRLAESHPEDLSRPVVPAGEIEIKPIEIAPLDLNGGQ